MLNVFQLPCCWSGYIPNKRLAVLRSNFQSAKLTNESRETVFVLFEQLESQNTAENVSEGSETMCNGGNLEPIMDRLTSLMSSTGDCRRTIFTKSMSQKTFLANSFSSGPVCTLNGNIVVVSEAKGITGSNYDCYFQAFIVGCDVILQHRSQGFPLEECSIVIILAFGDINVQLFGMYLMEPYFPCMTELTPIFNLHSRLDLRSLSICLTQVAEFSKETVRMLNASSGSKEILDISINAEKHFFKPLFMRHRDKKQPDEYVSSLRVKLNYIMHLHKLMESQDSEMILQPVGVMRYHAGAPIIVYPMLTADWKMSDDKIFQKDSYLKAVRRAVDVLNKSTVCHFDLRPGNIMHREKNGETEIRVIDFEESVEFGEYLPLHIPTCVEQYPVLDAYENRLCITSGFTQ